MKLFVFVSNKIKNSGLPDGPWVDKINILPNITACHRDNDLKLKFVKGKS